jgi:hypothetical protein
MKWVNDISEIKFIIRSCSRKSRAVDIEDHVLGWKNPSDTFAVTGCDSAYIRMEGALFVIIP